MNRLHGFTLIELLITVAIGAILMAVAIPGMNRFIQNDRLTSFSNSLVLDLMLARSTAVERNQATILCASSDENSCNSNDFSEGWIVLADLDNDGDIDDLVKVQQAIDGDISYNQAGLSVITFDNRGFIPTDGNIGTISVCDSRGNDHANTLSISRTGRVSRGADPACP